MTATVDERGAAASTGGQSALTVRNLWKVFGPRADKIVGSPDADLSRSELLAKTGCTAAVRDVSFDVAPGEVFVVMGLSGSGKSTLVRCLTRLIEPTAGQVMIDGEDVVAMSDSRLRELRRHHVSMVFQHFGLLPHRKVIDNVAYGLEIRGAEQGGATGQGAGARRPGRALRATRTPIPTSSPVACSSGSGWPARWPSTRRCCFFDEPFSALDPLIRRDMQNEVIRLHHEVGKTMVFITHDLAEALKLGDRILIMRDGALVQMGTPAEVVGAPADDYVRDFVSEVPRSHVLTLSWVMRPPRPDEAMTGPEMAPGTIVRDAARRVIDSEDVVKVVENGQLLGVVDQDDILRVIVAEETPS